MMQWWLILLIALHYFFSISFAETIWRHFCARAKANRRVNCLTILSAILKFYCIHGKFKWTLWSGRHYIFAISECLSLSDKVMHGFIYWPWKYEILTYYKFLFFFSKRFILKHWVMPIACFLSCLFSDRLNISRMPFKLPKGSFSHAILFSIHYGPKGYDIHLCWLWSYFLKSVVVLRF